MIDDMMCPVGIAALVGVAALGGGGVSALTGSGMGAELKSMQQQLAFESAASESRQAHLSDRSDIALQRYQQGCIVHVRHAANQLPEHTAVGAVTVEYLPVVEGDVARNPQTGGTYSRGVTLCDAWGNTGIVGDDGAIIDAAHTGSDVHSFVSRHFDNLWGGRRPNNL